MMRWALAGGPPVPPSVYSQQGCFVWEDLFNNWQLALYIGYDHHLYQLFYGNPKQWLIKQVFGG